MAEIRLRFRAGSTPGKEPAELGVSDHGHDREQTGEGDEPEPVEERIAPRDVARKPQPQGHHQRHRNGGGGYPPGVVGQCNDAPRRAPGLNQDQDVTGDDVVVERGPGNDAVGAERNPDGYADGYGNPQSPRANGAGRYLMGLDGHGDQGRLRDGGREPDREGEQVDPGVGLPVFAAVGLAARRTQEIRRRELLGHEFAQGEQGPFQPFEEEGQTQENQQEAQQHAVEVGNGTTQHQHLETDQDPMIGNTSPMVDRIEVPRESRYSVTAGSRNP